MGEPRCYSEWVLGQARAAWGGLPPTEILDLGPQSCELCGHQFYWGDDAINRFPNGLYRCDAECGQEGWHFVCRRCVDGRGLDADPDGLGCYLRECPDALRVAAALMGDFNPDCASCHDEGIVEIGGTTEGEPVRMAACGECAAGERVLEESRP